MVLSKSTAAMNSSSSSFSYPASVVLLLLLSLLCVFPNTGECQTFSCPEGTMASQRLNIGDKFVLCLFISAQPSPRSKMSFELKVDRHTSVLMQESGTIASNFLRGSSSEAAVYTWASASSVDASPIDCDNPTTGCSTEGGADSTSCRRSSCPQIYMTPQLVVPFVNLEITLRHGLLQSFRWTNGCFNDCNADSCLASPAMLTFGGGPLPQPVGQGSAASNACGVSREGDGCTPPGECPLVVFVTWTGTDSRHRTLSTSSVNYNWLRSNGLGARYNNPTSLFR